MKLEGLYTAMVTPFDAHGELDLEGFRDNLHVQLSQGVDGVVILGSTGEDLSLSPQERKMMLETAVKEVKGKMTLIVGTGSSSTKQAIANSLQAEELGADVAFVVTPYYNKPTQEGLYRHFSSICQTVSLPLCIYNAPSRTGQNLQVQTLRRLAAFPSLIGIKDCSGSMQQVTEAIEVMQRERPNFSVLSGDDVLTLPMMALGAKGIVSVASNLFPQQMQSLVQAVLKGKMEDAREWHYRLLPFFQACFIESNPIPIKAAMQQCGYAAGSCRLPLCNLSPTHLEEMKKILENTPSFWFTQHETQCARR